MIQSEEIKILQRLHTLGLEIEKSAPQFPKEKLATFTRLLSNFQNSQDLTFQKIAELEVHLHPQMTAQHFSNLLRPIERALDKNLKDDDFLITTADVKKEIQKLPLVFILDNLRSSFNVGSIFRTAECFGVNHIYCCGYTPTPESSGVQKTAMNTDSSVDWSSFQNIHELILKLKSEGHKIIALETCERAIDIEANNFSAGPTAFVLGNERFGLMKETLFLAEEVRQIPLRGQKNSLNVANSVAIATYEWVRQWRQ